MHQCHEEEGLFSAPTTALLFLHGYISYTLKVGLFKRSLVSSQDLQLQNFRLKVILTTSAEDNLTLNLRTKKKKSHKKIFYWCSKRWI